MNSPTNNKAGFPDYIEYQCQRLLPVARMLLLFSVIYLIGFGLLDFFKHPEHFQTILVLRLLAALPLMWLLALMQKPQHQARIHIYFLTLGLISFGFFLMLNLAIPEKKYIVVLVPIFYILAVLAMAPLFNLWVLLLTFVVGFLTYYASGSYFIQDNEYIRQVFPHMTAIVLFTLITVIKIKQSAEENYQLAKDLHWRSQYDELTAVYNRHGIFSWIKANQLFAGKSFEPISLAMLDLDHFKSINDDHGHDAGDAVIQRSADLLKKALGPESKVARFGGEEFLLILQEGSEALNLTTTQDVLQAFRALEVADLCGEDSQVTVSIGFVNHRSNHSFEQSLKKADDLMYQAKRTGRNRLITAQDAV